MALEMHSQLPVTYVSLQLCFVYASLPHQLIHGIFDPIAVCKNLEKLGSLLYRFGRRPEHDRHM